MPVIASARTKHLAAMLLIGAVAFISPSMALAHSGGGGSGGGHSGGGSSGGGSSSSGSHSSGHSTVSSSSHRTAAVSQERTDTTSSKNKKRWWFFGHSHVMHTGCLSEPEAPRRQAPREHTLLTVMRTKALRSLAPALTCRRLARRARLQLPQLIASLTGLPTRLSISTRVSMVNLAVFLFTTSDTRGRETIRISAAWACFK
jgi:hypothetical protein